MTQIYNKSMRETERDRERERETEREREREREREFVLQLCTGCKMDSLGTDIKHDTRHKTTPSEQNQNKDSFTIQTDLCSKVVKRTHSGSGGCTGSNPVWGTFQRCCFVYVQVAGQLHYSSKYFNPPVTGWERILEFGKYCKTPDEGHSDVRPPLS